MSIEERVERLEKGARWWRRMALICLAALAAVSLVGQAKEAGPGDLSVRSLTVVDGQRKQRIHLGLDQKGCGTVTLSDGDGRVCGTLQQGDFGRAELTLGTPRVGDRPHSTISLLGSPQGSCLFLRDKKGHQRVQLGWMINPSGKRDRRESPALYFFDEKTRPRVVLGTNNDTAHLMLLSERKSPGPMIGGGRPIDDSIGWRGVRLSVELDGSPHVSLTDQITKSKLALGVTKASDEATGETGVTEANSLTVFDAKGDVIWQAPR